MSKFYSGQDGQLFVNNENETIQATDQIAKVRSWSFTINTSVLETVSLGDFDRTIIPGITSTTGSASIYYYANPNNPRNANSPNELLSDQIIQKLLPRSSSNSSVPSSELRPKVKFRLGVDAKHYIDIKGVITSFSMTNSVGEVMAADISFEADGIPTENAY
jgi:hypothetical protein|tara:strand:- start:74 stop:559 length:486 start_codon:yes stop_codon:yes gene_type:complete